MKHNVIKQFVNDVAWDCLDYLVVDCPPGTGDEPLSIVQLLGQADGAVIVTTPQQLAVVDVKKCITFCRQLNLPVLGVIQNMSGFVCPHCNKKTDIFEGDGGRKMADDFNLPFLGSIPIDSALVSACDSGKPIIRFNSRTLAAQALENAFSTLLETDNKILINKEVQNKMRIAIPVTDGKLSAHFGHCEKFAIVDVDSEKKVHKLPEMVNPPAHEPGALPKWLAGMHVQLIIAGGMGQRAQQLFTQNNIEVVVGVPDKDPKEIVNQYLNGKLKCGQNICDH